MTTRRGLLGTLAGGIAGLSGCISNPLSGGSGSKSTPNATAVPSVTTREATPTPTATTTPTATATPTPTPVAKYAPSKFPSPVEERLESKRGKYGIEGLVRNEKLRALATMAAKRRGRGGSLDRVHEELAAIGCDNGGVLVAAAPRNDTVPNPNGKGIMEIDSVESAATYVVNKWTLPGEDRQLVVDSEITHLGVGSYVREQNVFVSAVLC
jgi:hypothetical protein